VVAVADCTFVRGGMQDADYSDLSEFGLFKYNLATDERQCVVFSNTVNLSAAAKTAKAFGVICCLLTSIIMLQVLSLQLFLQYKREFVWKMTRIQAIVAPLAQVLTFTAFGDENCSGSNVKCVPGAAGVIAIFNVLFLIALACVCWFATPPSQPLFEIKRLEAPTVPEEKPTTMEDIESDCHSIEDHSEQAPSSNRDDIFSYDIEAQPKRGVVASSKRDDTSSGDLDSQTEQVVAPNFKRAAGASDDIQTNSEATVSVSGSVCASGDTLDKVVKSVAADSEYTIKSVRPNSPDSEKRRLSFSLHVSPRKRKDESPTRLEV